MSSLNGATIVVGDPNHSSPPAPGCDLAVLARKDTTRYCLAHVVIRDGEGGKTEVLESAWMDFALSIICGGLITIATAIAVEYFRRPKLALVIENPPLDVTYTQQHPANHARYLRVKLRNEALPPGLRWMQRAAALQCRGEITFHHLDRQDIARSFRKLPPKTLFRAKGFCSRQQRSFQRST